MLLNYFNLYELTNIFLNTYSFIPIKYISLLLYIPPYIKPQ